MNAPGTATLRGKTLDRDTWRLRTAGPGTSARELGDALKPAGDFPAERTKLPPATLDRRRDMGAVGGMFQVSRFVQTEPAPAARGRDGGSTLVR